MILNQKYPIPYGSPTLDKYNRAFIPPCTKSWSQGLLVSVDQNSKIQSISAGGSCPAGVDSSDKPFIFNLTGWYGLHKPTRKTLAVSAAR